MDVRLVKHITSQLVRKPYLYCDTGHLFTDLDGTLLYPGRVFPISGRRGAHDWLQSDHLRQTIQQGLEGTPEDSREDRSAAPDQGRRNLI